MKLLVKDHKPLGTDGLPPTRPVVGASRGINVALSNILSDVIEPISKTIPNTGEVISSEHMLSEVNQLNKTWAARPQHQEVQQGVERGPVVAAGPLHQEVQHVADGGPVVAAGPLHQEVQHAADGGPVVAAGPLHQAHQEGHNVQHLHPPGLEVGGQAETVGVPEVGAQPEVTGVPGIRPTHDQTPHPGVEPQPQGDPPVLLATDAAALPRSPGVCQGGQGRDAEVLHEV